MKVVPQLFDLLPPNPLPQSNYEEEIIRIPVEGQSSKCMTSTPQNLKSLKISLRDCQNQELLRTHDG